jgi:AhpD family alkylhydroperoxidase
VSQSAGCRYCQAHTSHVAEKRGATADRIKAAFEFETSDFFSERERSALRIALHAGMVPNAADSEHFKAASEHFDERELVEIVAVISLFGALNRWNDTLATSLEASPIAFAESMLAGAGWSIGKHSA